MSVILFTVEALLISVGSGALGAMLGLGGGVIMVPLLVFLLKVPMHIAAGASIIAVLATSSAAAATYVKNDITNLRLGLFLELATTLGAVTGAFLTSAANEATLRMIFGLSLLYAAVTMYLQMRKMDRSWVVKPNDRLAESLHLNGSYFDVARSQRIEYGISKTPITLGISYIAGVISGLLGIGGGGVKVPAMNVVGNVPMKVAIATSNYMIGVTAAASALVYLRNGYCDVFITAPVVLGTLMGSFIGARMTNRVKGVVLKKVFTVILTLLAVRMIASGLGF
jgi:uncharacterized membrane protein YfcA